MKLKNFFKLLFFFLFSFNSVAKENIEDRVKKLTLELRCMTCQNQSVNDSDSDFAKDITRIVEEKFKDGLNEKEIKVYLTSRYGEYILFKPYFNSKNILLWVFPFVLFIVSSVIFIRNIKKNR